MPVSEADIELLEAHLDGELSIAADAALRDRLSSDHELAIELRAIRADRAVRVEVFESFEPADLAVKNLILGVRKQITKDAVRGDRVRILRYIASAAAVIMFSFTAGWLGKGRVGGQNQDGQPLPAIAQRDNSGSIDLTGNSMGNSGVGTLTSNMHSPQNAVPQNTAYQVNLTDPFGHVIAVQPFNTLDEAHHFQEDLGQWQREQQQNRDVEPVDYTAGPKEQF